MCPFQHWRIYWLKELKIQIGLSYSNHWLLYITWCVMETNVSSNIWLQATPISSWAIFLTKVVYTVRPNNIRCKLLFSQKFLTVKNAFFFLPELNPFYVLCQIDFLKNWYKNKIHEVHEIVIKSIYLLRSEISTIESIV